MTILSPTLALCLEIQPHRYYYWHCPHPRWDPTVYPETTGGDTSEAKRLGNRGHTNKIQLCGAIL